MSNTPRIAYLGDGTLPGPASYLAGIMKHFGLNYVHVSSSDPPDEGVFDPAVALYVLSDYPAANFDRSQMDRLCQRMADGAGLLMLGGWKSYHGQGGDYHRTPLADLLPVRMLDRDDRRNWPQLILVRLGVPHPITVRLPLDQPPSIGGYNEFEAAPGATVVLRGERYRVACAGEGVELNLVGDFPLLVLQETSSGPRGAGRRACLATDVAPHWVGGLVDWGDARLNVPVAGGSIEVGNHYAQLFRNLLVWCLGGPPQPPGAAY
jgi:hypothetical protein